MAITRKARPSATDDLILTDAERAATTPAATEPLTDAGADTSAVPTPVENPPATGEAAKPTPATAPRTAAGGHPFRRHEIHSATASSSSSTTAQFGSWPRTAV